MHADAMLLLDARLQMDRTTSEEEEDELDESETNAKNKGTSHPHVTRHTSHLGSETECCICEICKAEFSSHRTCAQHHTACMKRHKVIECEYCHQLFPSKQACAGHWANCQERPAGTMVNKKPAGGCTTELDHLLLPTVIPSGPNDPTARPNVVTWLRPALKPPSTPPPPLPKPRPSDEVSPSKHGSPKHGLSSSPARLKGSMLATKLGSECLSPLRVRVTKLTPKAHAEKQRQAAKATLSSAALALCGPPKDEHQLHLATCAPFFSYLNKKQTQLKKQGEIQRKKSVQTLGKVVTEVRGFFNPDSFCHDANEEAWFASHSVPADTTLSDTYLSHTLSPPI